MDFKAFAISAAGTAVGVALGVILAAQMQKHMPFFRA
jgi:ABC-type lipoprotein release transport system permease subunit